MAKRRMKDRWCVLTDTDQNKTPALRGLGWQPIYCTSSKKTATFDAKKWRQETGMPTRLVPYSDELMREFERARRARTGS